MLPKHVLSYKLCHSIEIMLHHFKCLPISYTYVRTLSPNSQKVPENIPIQLHSSRWPVEFTVTQVPLLMQGDGKQGATIKQ